MPEENWAPPLKRCGDNHGPTTCSTLKDTLNVAPPGLGDNNCSGAAHPCCSSYVSKTSATERQNRRPSATYPSRKEADDDTRFPLTKKGGPGYRRGDSTPQIQIIA